MSNFVKIGPVGAGLFHADAGEDTRAHGHTDGRDQDNSGLFCNFVNAHTEKIVVMDNR